MTDDPGGRSFAFGSFVLIPQRQLLLQGELPVRIGSRALDILTALAERPGELVSKRELIARVWPSTVVDESNLKVNMAALRRALGDGGPDDARYIATVTGRGYKLIVPVTTGVSPNLAWAPAAGTTRRHNLPTGTTRVIGRADAIDGIRRDFDVARLVSIVGPGGIGKTTVALAVAEHAIGAFRDGAWLVDLALTKDPHQVPSAVAAALGIAGNAAGILATLCKSLRDRQILLVLDSCEQVIEACAACASRILAEAAGVKILVTSREPLQLSGERVRRLPGLGLPPSSEHLTAQEALMFPAVQLFVDRATDRMETFKLRDADATAVAEICRRLDGIALAIELAATRIDAFGVGGLHKQLDNRFRLLVGRRSGPERHRTLAATLDWSYSLLAEREAALLRSVSVFAGVFDIEGAAVVAAMDPAEAADMLAQLSAKSLLVADLDADGIAYRLQETTNSYCQDKLRAGGHEPVARQRHAEHTYVTLERAGSEWAQRPADEWESAYRRVLGDLRAALAWTVKEAPDGPLAIRLTVAGLLLWNQFSLTEECLRHVSHAVEELDAAGLAGTAFEMKLKLWLGCSTMLTREFRHQAMAALRRALAIAEGIGDTDYRLRCLVMIGIYELFTGEHEAGMRTLEEFEAVAGAEDPSVLPEGDVHMGIAELFLGRLPRSRERLERLARRDLRYFGSYAVRYLSDPIVLVRAVLTHVQWLTGSADAAMRTAAVAVDEARQTKHHLSMNNILSYACPVFYWSGAYDECERYVAMLEDHVARHGLVSRRPVASFYAAAVAYARHGSSPDVIFALQRAIGEFRNINHLARMPYYLSVLANALADRGRFAEAESTIRTALDIAAAQHELWCLPEVLRIQAAIAALQGRKTEAAGLLVNALEVATETGALAWRLRVAIDLATLSGDGEEGAAALGIVRAALDEFTEGFATRDLAAAAALVGAQVSAQASD
ncbi:ATPase [Pseudoduganella flava]|uniref:ATPase n=2 Tax=Pseudoduganella flava TaxID=871742 RepID=A0ABX6G5Y7_9BURK|nr:ATPase [Pseudoduganella flava]